MSCSGRDEPHLSGLVFYLTLVSVICQTVCTRPEPRSDFQCDVIVCGQYFINNLQECQPFRQNRQSPRHPSLPAAAEYYFSREFFN